MASRVLALAPRRMQLALSTWRKLLVNRFEGKTRVDELKSYYS